MRKFKIKRRGSEYRVFSRTWLIFWHRENLKYHESYCGRHYWYTHDAFETYAGALTFITNIRKKLVPKQTYYV